jgi:hypothetical protein
MALAVRNTSASHADMPEQASSGPCPTIPRRTILEIFNPVTSHSLRRITTAPLASQRREDVARERF